MSIHKTKRIPLDRFIELPNGIRSALPNEDPAIYYMPYDRTKDGTKCYPKGKLYKKYIKFINRLREQGLKKSSTKADSPGLSYEEIVDEPDEDINYLQEVGEDEMNF